MSGGSEANHDTLRDQAIAWLVRVQSDAATAEDWNGLTDWLDLGPEHQAAFNEVEQFSEALSREASEIAPRVTPSHGQVIAFKPRRRAWVRGVVTLAAAAACLAVVPFVWGSYQGQATTYRTGVGEVRALVLADGTHIRLDAGSTMSVRLGWTARRVTLGEAEAAFDVAKNPNRPFVITVGDQEVKVVGTEFNIRHYDKKTVVTVRRGVVQVRQPDLGPQPIAILRPGEELRHAEGAAGSVRAQVEPNAAFAWTEGRLEVHDQPLSEIVAYLNRRYPVPIRVSQVAAGRRFSGVLKLGDQDELARRLAAYCGLTVHRAGHEFILH